MASSAASSPKKAGILSQAYYFGSVNDNPAHRVEVIEGAAIDQLDELDEIWLGKRDTHSRRSNGKGDFRSGSLDEDALLAAIINGESYHVSCTRLLGNWAQQGVPFLDAMARLYAAFDQVEAFRRDARWQQRRDDPPGSSEISTAKRPNSAPRGQAL